MKAYMSMSRRGKREREEGEEVQHSVLTTACLHKKEHVWSAPIVSMSTCWAKEGEFYPEESVFHNINFTAQQDQTTSEQSCWLKSHYFMYTASGVNKWFQYYLLDKKVIAFVMHGIRSEILLLFIVFIICSKQSSVIITCTRTLCDFHLKMSITLLYIQ